MKSDFPFLVAGKLAVVVEGMDKDIPWCIKSKGREFFLTVGGTWSKRWQDVASFDYVTDAVEFAKMHSSQCEEHDPQILSESWNMRNNGKEVHVFCNKCKLEGTAILSISIGPITWGKP